MSILTLDRNRPYGEVHGEDTGGAFFDQDGFLFDFEGNLLEHLLDAKARAKLENMKATAEAQAAAKAAYEASLRGAGISPADAPEMPLQGEEDAPPAPHVDLHGWVTGAAKYQFFAVKDALREQYGFSPTNKEAALVFLRNELGIQS